jgi:two-component SAPR family response regulator
VASIVVFDEELDSFNLMKRVLERQAHRVAGCADAKEALRLVCTNPPDLLIISVRQGGKESLELAGHIRSLDTNVKVMMICDHVPETTEGDDFLISPVEIETIESKVRELLAQ